MQVLSLDGNMLSGEIPSEFGSLVNLEVGSFSWQLLLVISTLKRKFLSLSPRSIEFYCLYVEGIRFEQQLVYWIPSPTVGTII